MLLSCVSIEAIRDGYIVAPLFTTSSYTNTGAGVRGDRQAAASQWTWKPKLGASLTAVGNSIIMGYAHKFSTVSTTTIFSALDSSGNNVWSVGQTSAGEVTFIAAGTTTSATAPLVANQFAYIEVKFQYLAATTATVTVRVNGTVVITGSISFGQNLSTITTFQRISSGSTPRGMDFYCLDSTGSVNNDFLGDCRVEHLVPTAEGANTAWTLGAGASKTAAVTAPTDADTSYIRTEVAGDRQTFTLTDPVITTGTVMGLQVVSRAHGELNGSEKVGGTVRTGGSSYDSTDYSLATAVAATYLPCVGTFETNPGTSSAWTVSEIQALEAGPVVLP